MTDNEDVIIPAEGKSIARDTIYSDRSGSEPVREIEQAKRELAEFKGRGNNNG